MPITIHATTQRARGENLTYKWEFLGPGKLDGERSAVFYILPEKIEGKGWVKTPRLPRFSK